MIKKNLNKLVCPKSLLLLSLALLAALSTYVGLKQGASELYIGTVPSDVVSYHTLLAAPLENGDIYANGIHTFLLKYPLILLQNLFGFSETALTISAVLLMLVTNFGIAWLIWRFSGRNKLATCLGILALTLTGALVNVGYYFMAQSWMTVRNIEIPLLLGLMVLAVSAARLKSQQKLLVALGLALNFVSDRLTMYYFLAGLALFLLVSFLRTRRDFLKRYRSLLQLSAVAMILSFVIEFALDASGLVKFAYTYPSSVGIVQSLGQFFQTLWDGIGGVFYVFGADIWNSQFWQAPLYLVSSGLVLTVAALSFMRVKRYIKDVLPEKKTKPDFFSQEALVFLICFSAASFGCYVMLNHTQGLGVDARFLIFTVAIGILTLTFALRDWQPRLKLKLLIPALAVVTLFGVGAVVTMNQLYVAHTAALDRAKFTYQTTVDILRKENISVLAGGYPYLHTIKFLHDAGNPATPLQIPIMLDRHCNVADSKSARKSWFTPSPDARQRTALFSLLSPCSEQQMTKVYGAPATKYLVTDQNGQHEATVYIFDYDIRSKYDMSQF
jgi:hypothetical protein